MATCIMLLSYSKDCTPSYTLKYQIPYVVNYHVLYLAFLALVMKVLQYNFNPYKQYSK